MTPDRARSLLVRMRMGEVPMAYRRKCDVGNGPLDPDGLTESEDRAVKAVWEMMPGDTCWLQALRAIASGETPAPVYVVDGAERTQARVYASDRGFTLVVVDLEARQTLPHAKIFEDLACARAFADAYGALT